MSIIISKISNQGFLINGKAIYQDFDGTWKSEMKLELLEIIAFKQHLKCIYPSGKNIVRD